METGGDCLVFDILQVIPNVFNSLQDVKEAIATSIKPDILLRKCNDR
jgi:hypothetical protein